MDAVTADAHAARIAEVGYTIVEDAIDRSFVDELRDDLLRLGPGEVAQPIHADDQLIPIAKPHEPTVCNSMWALTDFTEANGATRIIPGTHLADSSPSYGKPYDSIAVYNGLIGHIDKRSPAELLSADAEHRMVWDLA